MQQNEARAVFEILVRENQAMLLTYFRAAVRDQVMIDDLFQQTMLVAWRKLDDFDRSRPFGPWLRGIAAKLVLSHYRKAKSDIMLSDEETLEYLSQKIQRISEKPGDTWEEKVTALHQCIETLAEHYQLVITLRYYEELTVSRVATLAKVSLATIQKRLQRARALILDCLKRKKVVVEMTT